VTEQVPYPTPSFETTDFADNPEPRCPCLLLLDTSGSMQTNNAIAELNAGLVTFKEELAADTLAMKRVEIAIVTFGPPQVVSEFHTAETFVPPPLVASGDTPMGAAIITGLELLRRRKESYRANGISFYRPWVFLITDGEPTDDWQAAAAAVRAGEDRKSFAFFAVGVENANMATLAQISAREPLRLRGLQFRSLFQWLSSSMRSVSQSTPGDTVPMANPAAPGGWAAV
jgi:uncharacterized protein YegL